MRSKPHPSVMIRFVIAWSRGALAADMKRTRRGRRVPRISAPERKCSRWSALSPTRFRPCGKPAAWVKRLHLQRGSQTGATPTLGKTDSTDGFVEIRGAAQDLDLEPQIVQRQRT